MSQTDETVLDLNEQIKVRRAKLAELRENGQAYPNNFESKHHAKGLHADYDQLSHEALEAKPVEVSCAGRMMTRRLMGKASFVTLQDRTGKIQLYLQKALFTDAVYEAFKHWDIGDILGARGVLFKTKTGELTVKVNEVVLLTKALRPLPDKFHGLADREICQRQRYLDLMANETTRERFLIRSKIIDAARDFLKSADFLEVETPMMQPLPGGAIAKPFITHHNALDLTLYLRVAPELYLKRLVVGGFDRVFEVNRNFRNEGISTRHNPEFTMLEYYEAYADYESAMARLEQMIATIASQATGSTTIRYQDKVYDLAKPFRRLTLVDALMEHAPEIQLKQLEDLESISKLALEHHIKVKSTWGRGKILLELFEKLAEAKLDEPTFITGYPSEVSPLARPSDDDPFFTDRFELFIAGRELANGFSELNDPDDQKARFIKQAEEKAAGDEEAMPYDEDYINALEYGMPPTAGVGIGIDRLVMFLTDMPSIREVILFPHLKEK